MYSIIFVHPFLPLIFIILLHRPLSFASDLIAKPGCKAQCGSVSIPYPFGIGPKCSIGPSFDITCNTTTNPPKAYLTDSWRTNQIIEINQSQLRIQRSHLLTRTCYSENGPGLKPGDDSWTGVSFGEHYTLSDENWLTAIGCDDLVLGVEFDERSLLFGGGCAAYCNNNHDFGGFGFCPDNGNDNSPGNGCCRTPISRGLPRLGAQLTDLSAKWRDKKLFPCSFAFIQEKVIGNQPQFRYPLSYLQNNSKLISAEDDEVLGDVLPIVLRLDWRVGTESCSQARRNTTTFACGHNTVCHDFVAANLRGYNCNCLQGYRGNPYLSGTRGCQDINECEDRKLNPCASNSICENTLGSVNCSCRDGYYGDGRKNGTGCTRIPHSRENINRLIGLSSASGFLLLLAMCFWLHKIWQKRKHKMRKVMWFKRNGGLLLQQRTNEHRIFSASELETSTDCFNESRIIGRGGQGIVYKGMLTDGKIVAVKKSKLVDENLLEAFVNEVVILSQINHRNIVKLLGCCLETEVPMLVYEFLPNGTLFDLIHDSNTKTLVSWNMRLKIAADVAAALAYIHSASSVPIYHRDIKSNNILLDEKYVVKIADFGLSRTVPTNQTHMTTMVRGTFGYFDPEYFRSNQYSEKSEVYSFGVVLAELLTGKKPVFLGSSDEEKENESLATCFLERMEENRLDAILDPQVLEHGRMEEVVAVGRLAERCLNLKRKMRPTMKEVAAELEIRLRISQRSTDFNEAEEARVSDDIDNPIIISDINYPWDTSGIDGTSSSSILSDTIPMFMSQNV